MYAVLSTSPPTPLRQTEPSALSAIEATKVLAESKSHAGDDRSGQSEGASHLRGAHLRGALPRIPFAADYWAFAEAGKALAALHLDYEKLSPWELEFVETPGVPLSYRVEDKLRLSKDKARLVVNRSLALAGIPAEALEYRLGNRSAVEWVIEQYQVGTDARSGITSDPNRQDDPQYIVRLVGQVVRVSLETVRIVNALPKEYAPASAERTG
jgi:predicted helicase